MDSFKTVLGLQLFLLNGLRVIHPAVDEVFTLVLFADGTNTEGLCECSLQIFQLAQWVRPMALKLTHTMCIWTHGIVSSPVACTHYILSAILSR
jgi:hypothetical protein